MICFLLRHADAGDPALWSGEDGLRPLTEVGHAQAADVAALLARTGLRPDVLVSSPRVRADQTAGAVAEALGLDVRVDPRLAGRLDAGVLREIVGETSRPCLVGHDPDLSTVLAELLGMPSVEMPKAALAVLDIDHFGRGGARLIGFVRRPWQRAEHRPARGWWGARRVRS